MTNVNKTQPSAGASKKLWLLVLVAVVAIAAVWIAMDKRSSGKSDRVSPSTDVAATSPRRAVSQATIDKITDRWLRPDGGYVIDIRGSDLDGNLDAAYYNPRSINVSQALVMETPNGIEVFVELRDTNYPGAKYKLIYDENQDALLGLYYQPALSQTFEVMFVRESVTNQ